MPLFLDQGVLALGVAVGVLGLVLLLSLIVAYAYEEPTLLALAGYLSAMVAASFLSVLLDISAIRVNQILLVSGPALLSGLLLWLLKNRQATLPSRVGLALVALPSAVVVGLYAFAGDAGMFTAATMTRAASVVWFLLLSGFAIYLVAKSWHTTGPWKWWVLAGHGGGLAVSSLFFFGSGQC